MINEEALRDITQTNRKAEFARYKKGCSGTFTTWLLDAWGVADSNNQYRLSVSFPELAKAIKEYNESDNQKEYIESLLKGERK